MWKQSAAWTVWRIDDNANTFVVMSGLSKDEADRLASEFASHGHKQTYWVEPDQMPRDKEHNSDPTPTPPASPACR